VGSRITLIMRDYPTLGVGTIDRMVEAGARSFSIHHTAPDASRPTLSHL